jgi:hypothetical protein
LVTTDYLLLLQRALAWMKARGTPYLARVLGGADVLKIQALGVM